MGKALYRKYRSKSLADVVGQEHITTTLEHALKSGNIAHAYLFTGPRGVGKTSIARILAHEINQLPYTDESQHLDIIEIDAASNRRIDEIRDLRDKVHIAPSSAKYKVYIIDEVHMLTKEAFNALLKTLEEPPSHVIFILATTEAHKLPETIVSRTQRFTFKAIDRPKVVEHLKTIAKTEAITISDDALDLIAEHAEGGMRDSISLLDQIRHQDGAVTKEHVETMLGIAPLARCRTLLQAARTNNTKSVIQELHAFRDEGFSPATIAKQLSSIVRSEIAESGTSEISLILLEELLGIPSKPDPFIALEIALMRLALAENPPASTQQEQPLTTPQAEPQKHSVQPKHSPQSQENLPKADTGDQEPKEQAKPRASEAAVAAVAVSRRLPKDSSFDDIWTKALETIKTTKNTLYGILRLSETRLEDGTIILAFQFPFHQKRANDAKNKTIITQTMHDLTGNEYQIKCIVSTPTPSVSEVTAGDTLAGAEKTVQAAITQQNTPPESILAVFGGGEVLESE